MNKTYRRYDPRLKNLVIESGDIERFSRLGIPKSTLREWIKNGPQDYFTLPELSMDTAELVIENQRLTTELEAIQAKQNLLLRTIRIFGFQIQFKRLPRASAKVEILAAIKAAHALLPLKACLDLIGLSAARYHGWIKRQVKCLLQDQPSCPRVSPTRLTAGEIQTIKELYTDKRYSHFSVLSLSLWAKRAGKVMASASSWSRIIREAGLKRNKVRVYPTKPRIGIRASAPFQILHIDVTILRLMDGTRAFIQCVIDNFSRYVLAWKVSCDYGGLRTRELLTTALSKAKELGLRVVPNVFCDSGSENINADVDSMISAGQILRTIAQIDVEFSNSMIEALFLRLKHRYLFTFPLTNFEALEKGAEFFFTESNTVIPHSALGGATPEEIISGKWNEEKIEELKNQIKTARILRRRINLALKCPVCLA